jgi:hypothetical protein
LLYGVMHLDRAEPTLAPKCPFNGVGVSGEGIGRDLGYSENARTEISEEGAAVLAVPLADAEGK